MIKILSSLKKKMASLICRYRQLNHFRKLKRAFNKLPIHSFNGWYLSIDFFVPVDSTPEDSKELFALKNIEDGKLMRVYCFDIESNTDFDIEAEIDEVYNSIYDALGLHEQGEMNLIVRRK